MATPMPAPSMPQMPPLQRARMAYQSRGDSDYIFSFWTALGWTVLTFGIYGFYVVYQLVRRSRDHNRRRLELLDATTAFAWEKATAVGRAEELQPQFQRVAAHLDPLRRLSGEFREPAVWLVLDILTGFVYIVVLVLMDQDLVKHEWSERAAEAELAGILTALEMPVPAPSQPTKQKHNYVGRVFALIFSLGFYGLWWTHNVMEEGNRHFREDWVREDALAQALQAAG